MIDKYEAEACGLKDRKGLKKQVIEQGDTRMYMSRCSHKDVNI